MVKTYSIKCNGFVYTIVLFDLQNKKLYEIPYVVGI